MADILCAWLRKGHCLLVYSFRVISLPFVCFRILETLRLRFFGVSREPRRSKSHVTRALPSGLGFEVHVYTVYG